MVECKVCKKEVKNFIGLSKHIVIHDISDKTYYDTYLLKNDSEKICSLCNNHKSFVRISKGYSKKCECQLINHICKICSEKITGGNNLNVHVILKHNIDNKQYYDKYLLNNDSEKTCSICKNETKFVNCFVGYRKTCGNETCVSEQNKLFCLKKYGTSSPIKNKDIKEKAKNTLFKNYGVLYNLQSKEIRDKSKLKHLQKYGVEYPTQREEIKQKTKETNIERHGVEYLMQSEEIKDKATKTYLKNYNVVNPSQNEEIKIKKIKTTMKHFGVENPFQSEEIKDRIKKNYLNKYDVEHPSQVLNIHLKQQRFKRKDYILPSGKVIKIQGYENFALDLLLKEYSEDEISFDSKDIPRISYRDEYEKDRKYFPDLYIAKENLIIEVKSIYTFEKDLNVNLAKRKSTIESGYNFKFMIFDEKLNLTEEIL